MKFKLSLFLIVLLQFELYGQSDLGIVRGKIIDKKTKSPLFGANIVLLNSEENIGCSSDENGRFELRNVPFGPATIKFSMIGYQSVVKSDIIVSKSTKSFVNIELEPTIIELKEEAVIKADYFYKPYGTISAVNSYSAEEIKRDAGTFNDISRMMQSFAGVITTNDLRNDILVRGGNPTENLFLVDGFEIQSINHFSTQGGSGGTIGFLQTEFLKETNFYVGGFPTKYAGRLSAAMDIRFNDGDIDNNKYKFDLSMAGSGFLFEGKLSSDISALFSVRRSFLELFSSVVGTWGAIPVYSNLNAKVAYNLSSSSKLNFLFLGGMDKIYMKDDPKLKEEERLTEEIKNRNRSYLSGVNFRHIYSNQFVSDLYLWRNYNYYYFDVIDVYENHGRRLAKNDSYETVDALKYEFSFLPEQKITIEGGINLKIKGIMQNLFKLGDTAWTNTPVYFEDENYRVKKNIIISESYINLSSIAFQRFIINFGTAFYYNDFLRNNKTIDIRGGLSFLASADFRINLSTGSFSQFPELVWLYSENGTKENDHLLYLKSRHYILGFEYYPYEATRLSFELFYKTHKNYPVSIDLPFYSLLNSGQDYGANIWSNIVSKGSARHYGLDFSFHKKLAKDFYGIISYSYLRSYYKALDGIERKTSFDIPHSFNLSGGYIFSRHFETSFKVKYFVGQPTAKLDIEKTIRRDVPVIDVYTYNKQRNPDYFRLDWKFIWRQYYEKTTLSGTLEIFNLTNKRNIFLKTWNKRVNKEQYIYQYSLMIAGGFILEF